MIQDQEIKGEKQRIYFELITSEDSRYQNHKKEYSPINNGSNKDPVIPIISFDTDDISPLMAATVNEEFEQYIDENPDIMHNILTCDEKNILETYPYEKPHTDEIKICEIIVLNNLDSDTGYSVIFDFDFDELMKICC